MSRSLIENLSDKRVKAVLDAVDTKDYVYGRLFPVKKVENFSWKLFMQQAFGDRMGDVQSDNASTIAKSRPIFQSAGGELPFITYYETMTRSELKEYQVAKAMAGGDPDAAALVRFYGDRNTRCYRGVNNRLEFIAGQILSMAGKLAFTPSNNAAYAQEFDMDYQVENWQKTYATTSFATADEADFIGTVSAAQNALHNNGKPYAKYAIVNMAEFYKIAAMSQIVKKTQSLIATNLGLTNTPDLSTINKMLANEGGLYGIQLFIYDHPMILEKPNGTIASIEAFANNRMTLVPDLICGSTQYDLLQNGSSKAVRATRAHVTVANWGEEMPMTEHTLGYADAAPVFNHVYSSVFVKTDGSAW